MALELKDMHYKEIPQELKRRLSGKIKKIKKTESAYVYFLYDKQRKDFVYVGKTIDLESRIRHHKSDKIFTDVYVFETKNAHKWELYWQRKLVPMYCNDPHLKKHKNRRKVNSVKRFNSIIEKTSDKLKEKNGTSE